MQRISLIQDYFKILVIPTLHLSTVSFFGMDAREQYLVWKETGDLFSALDSRLTLTTWKDHRQASTFSGSKAWKECWSWRVCAIQIAAKRPIVLAQLFWQPATSSQTWSRDRRWPTNHQQGYQWQNWLIWTHLWRLQEEITCLTVESSQKKQLQAQGRPDSRRCSSTRSATKSATITRRRKTWTSLRVKAGSRCFGWKSWS